MNVNITRTTVVTGTGTVCEFIVLAEWFLNHNTHTKKIILI